MLDALPITRCRTCGARIIWAVSGSTHRPMPLNAKPSAEGNLRLRTDLGPGMAPIVEVVSGAEREALRTRGEAFVSHYATCPQASKWRRPRGIKDPGDPERPGGAAAP